MQIVRCTIDLFRPIPLRPLSVTTEVRREGRRIQVVDASLFDGDVELGRATALKIRTTEVDLPVADNHVDGTGRARDHRRPRLGWLRGPIGAEIPLRRRRDPQRRRQLHRRTDPGLSWFRLKYPLVAGEEPTPFVRLATLTDMANGNARAIDPDRWLFVNPDITLYCHRPPVGEYVGMHSAAFQQPTGIGVTDTWLFDQTGALGQDQSGPVDRTEAPSETVDERTIVR